MADDERAALEPRRAASDADDFRAEALVVHRALFAILDQLQGGGGPAAAGA